MKKHKKLPALLLVTLLVMICASIALLTVSAEGESASIADYGALIDKYNAAAAFADKKLAFRNVENYIASHAPVPSVPAGEEGYDKYAAFLEKRGAYDAAVAFSFDEAEALLNNYDTSAEYLAKKIAYNEFLRYAEIHRPIEDAADYDTRINAYNEKLAAVKADHEREMRVVMEENRLRLAAAAPVSEYGYAHLTKSSDFSMSSITPSKMKSIFGEINNYQSGVKYGIHDDNGNGVLSVDFADSASADFFFQPIPDDYKLGTGFDFDLTTYGTFPWFLLEVATNELDDSGKPKGNRIWVDVIAIDSDGIKIGGGPNNAAVSGAANITMPIAEGEMNHLTVIWSQTRENRYQTFKVYVDYVEVYNGEVDFGKNFVGSDGIRFCVHHAVRDGRNYGIDNWKSFAGTAYRDDGYIESLDDAGRLAFYVNVLTDGKQLPKDRKAAKEFVDENIPLYYNAGTGEYTDLATDEIKVTVEKYLSEFDADSFLESLYTYNLDTLEEYVKTVENTARLTSNAAKRAANLNSFAFYLQDNEFDTTMQRYLELIARYSTQLSYVKNDMTAEDFLRTVKALKSSVNFARKTEKYNSAMALRAQFTPDGLTGDTELAEALDYYDRYPDIYNRELSVHNSELFIYYMEKLSGYPDVAAWEENYETVKRYVLMARRIILSGSYDGAVDGFTLAWRRYQPIENYVISVMQEEHIVMLRSIADRYMTATSYVEKNGLCLYAKQYLEENASTVNLSDSRITALTEVIENFRRELAASEEEYRAELVRNTTLFRNTVLQLRAVTTFAELAKLVNEGNVYYYAMNLEDEETELMSREFEIYRAAYEEGVYQSELLRMNYEKLTATSLTDHEAFWSLMCECRDSAAYIDATAAGMEDVYAGFMSIYNAYLSMLDTVYAEYGTACGAVSAVQSVAGAVCVPKIDGIDR